jgi:SAM-dependent methyltransferase
MNPDISQAEFWEARYQNGTTRWDLGHPSPALVDWVQQHPTAAGRSLVLGCGRGHDALFLARAGFDVVGVDFAPGAIAAATAAAQAQSLEATFLQRDIFDLLPDYREQFDYGVEHTCFCAIDPRQRDRYVDLVHGLLKPGGYLIGIFFTHQRPGGPPFGATPADIRQHFSRCFEVQSLTPVPNSVPQRTGEEHLGCFQRR